MRTQEVTLGELELNAPLRRVTVRGRAVSLSWTEFELLSFLAANPDTAFSRETIFRKVWKQEYYISTNLVDVCVHRLRQKIESNPAEPRYVVTVHGVGYMFLACRQRLLMPPPSREASPPWTERTALTRDLETHSQAGAPLGVARCSICGPPMPFRVASGES